MREDPYYIAIAATSLFAVFVLALGIGFWSEGPKEPEPIPCPSPPPLHGPIFIVGGPLEEEDIRAIYNFGRGIELENATGEQRSVCAFIVGRLKKKILACYDLSSSLELEENP